MQYRVVPFVASIQGKDRSETVAEQLQALINKMASDGYEYLRLESVETYIAGSSGCFGIGARPDVHTSFSMAVFKK